MHSFLEKKSAHNCVAGRWTVTAAKPIAVETQLEWGRSSAQFFGEYSIRSIGGQLSGSWSGILLARGLPKSNELNRK